MPWHFMRNFAGPCAPDMDLSDMNEQEIIAFAKICQVTFPCQVCMATVSMLGMLMSCFRRTLVQWISGKFVPGVKIL